MKLNNSTVPRVLVLMAVCNGRHWLPVQVDSILAQEAVSVQLQVSLDASVDDSEAWLHQLAVAEARVQVLPVEGVFGSAARNFYRLLRDADLTGVEAVALADQDDIWQPDRLARAWQKLADGGAYSSDVEAFWPDGRRRVLRKSQPQKRWDFLFESGGPGCSFVLSATLATALQVWVKENWNEVQQVQHHDWLIYAFARAKGFTWFIDSYPGIAYRQHGANELGARVGWSGIERRVRRVWHGEGFSQAALVAELVGLGEDEFVRSWVRGQRGGYLRLALAARQCRRYWLDQFFFALLCLKAWLRGK